MRQSPATELLLPIFQQYEPLLIPQIEDVAERTSVCILRPGDHFPLPGQSPQLAAYVVQGVFRVYSVDASGAEKVLRLPCEGDFTMRLASPQEIRPSVQYYWEALTDAVLLTWEYTDMEYLARHVPHWYSFTVRVTQRIFLQAILERAEMINDDATVRYRKFMERYPCMVHRLPLRYVASYLGIAPQSLSRIRHQLGVH
jgi:CRP-like cAMP-binding protein